MKISPIKMRIVLLSNEEMILSTVDFVKIKRD